MSRIETLVKKILEGDVVAAAKLITIAENADKGENEEIIRLISPNLGNTFVIGITGAPGVGKSTLTDKLVKLLRKKGYKIGIIAVDPTSPFSGGAILGDRIRLQQLATDENVFIRSMASRGHLGGISSATGDTIKILDAFGCDYIFVETVGVGQSEIEIVKNVDTTILVMIPGMGDEIQAIKAGIMEIADIFVVNKADKDGVERTVLEIEMLQNLGEQKEYLAPIQKVVARDNIGVEKLWEKIENHRTYLLDTGKFQTNRKARLKMELRQAVHNKLLKHSQKSVEKYENLAETLEEIYAGKTDIYSVANSITKKLLK